MSSREGSPGANSARAVFLSVLTQRHLLIILGTFGRYWQQVIPARDATKFSTDTASTANDRILCLDCDYRPAVGPTKTIRGVFLTQLNRLVGAFGGTFSAS